MGAGRVSSFFVSICSAFDIAGLNEAISWVHSSPICTTLNIPFFMLLSVWLCNIRFGSNSSSTVPIWKCCHVCFATEKKTLGYFRMNLKLWGEKKNCSLILELTIVTRLSEYSEALLLLFCLPVTISNKSTPKLYTSAFSVNWPWARYSGAMYPLQIHQNKSLLRPVNPDLIFDNHV